MTQSIYNIVNDRGEVRDRQRSLNLREYNCALVIGLGGIGSWVALNLALTGQIKKLVMYDSDTIENTNLNRTLFRICDIGRNKTDVVLELILERRIDIDIVIYNEKYDENSLEVLKGKGSYPEVVIDCRDNIFKDIKQFSEHTKVWKLGYDGLSVTIDGNPRHTTVMGTSARGNYDIVPSFVCSAQLVANLVCNHILMPKYSLIDDGSFSCNDKDNLFNKLITFDTGRLLEGIYLGQNVDQQPVTEEVYNANDHKG